VRSSRSSSRLGSSTTLPAARPFVCWRKSHFYPGFDGVFVLPLGMSDVRPTIQALTQQGAPVRDKQCLAPIDILLLSPPAQHYCEAYVLLQPQLQSPACCLRRASPWTFPPDRLLFSTPFGVISRSVRFRGPKTHLFSQIWPLFETPPLGHPLVYKKPFLREIDPSKSTFRSAKNLGLAVFMSKPRCVFRGF